jgi:peptidoglycan/xylan/chitin deacetylase (PgdA/CDA1 family)
MSRKALYLRVTLGLCCALFLGAEALGQQASGPTAAGGREPFRWPAGKRAALSLTFDDARLSQIDTGLALLDKYGIKATFYVSVDNLEKRLEGWKRAVASGHEIGNHSRTHPCTGNYEFSLKNALEDYTLPMMEKELDGASADIQRLLGVTPLTFAYPCGQKFVGRGREVKSYVPLVAEPGVLRSGAGDGQGLRRPELRAGQKAGSAGQAARKVADSGGPRDRRPGLPDYARRSAGGSVPIRAGPCQRIMG